VKSAIELVVAAYVDTNQLSALQDLKVHRETLAASVRNRMDFNFGVLLGQLDDDIRESKPVFADCVLRWKRGQWSSPKEVRVGHVAKSAVCSLQRR
jgi:hypothetical protein